MTLKKKITLGCFAALLVGLIVLTIVRWEVWFGNPPEAPYVPSANPTRVLLTFGDNGEMSRNVSWMCDTVVREAHLEVQSEGATQPLCESRRRSFCFAQWQSRLLCGASQTIARRSALSLSSCDQREGIALV